MTAAHLKRALLLAAALLLPRTLSAQARPDSTILYIAGIATAETAVPACVKAVPDSARVATVMYLHPTEPAELSRDAVAQLDAIDILTQLVSERLRAQLHAAPAVVPRGEPLLAGGTLDAVIVTAARDGHFVVRTAPTPISNAANARRPVIAVLLDSLRAEGELFLWNSAGTGDSASFRLELLPATFASDGKLTPPAVRIGIPIATFMAPRAQLATVREMKKLRPPEFERRAPYRDPITMEFVVDITGHVDPQSIRDIARPNLMADRVVIYDAYVATLRRVLEGATFEPARVGGCAVSQVVIQKFDFWGSGS